MKIIELEEKEGYMYVNATHRVIAYSVYCPDTDAHLWALTPEDEAIDLETQWKAEKEAESKAREQTEGESPEPPRP